MTTNIIPKMLIAREAGVLFDTAITSEYIELTNYKYIDFVLSSGAGTAEDTTVSILGKRGEDGIEKAVSFKCKNDDGTFDNAVDEKSVSVGGTAGSCGNHIFRITADDLSKEEFDRVAIKTTAISNTTVAGCIVAVCYEPRYSE